MFSYTHGQTTVPFPRKPSSPSHFLVNTRARCVRPTPKTRLRRRTFSPREICSLPILCVDTVGRAVIGIRGGGGSESFKNSGIRQAVGPFELNHSPSSSASTKKNELQSPRPQFKDVNYRSPPANTVPSPTISNRNLESDCQHPRSPTEDFAQHRLPLNLGVIFNTEDIDRRIGVDRQVSYRQGWDDAMEHTLSWGGHAGLLVRGHLDHIVRGYGEKYRKFVRGHKIEKAHEDEDYYEKLKRVGRHKNPRSGDWFIARWAAVGDPKQNLLAIMPNEPIVFLMHDQMDPEFYWVRAYNRTGLVHKHHLTHVEFDENEGYPCKILSLNDVNLFSSGQDGGSSMSAENSSVLRHPSESSVANSDARNVIASLQQQVLELKTELKTALSQKLRMVKVAGMIARDIPVPLVLMHPTDVELIRQRMNLPLGWKRVPGNSTAKDSSSETAGTSTAVSPGGDQTPGGQAMQRARKPSPIWTPEHKPTNPSPLSAPPLNSNETPDSPKVGKVFTASPESTQVKSKFPPLPAPRQDAPFAERPHEGKKYPNLTSSSSNPFHDPVLSHSTAPKGKRADSLTEEDEIPHLTSDEVEEDSDPDKTPRARPVSDTDRPKLTENEISPSNLTESFDEGRAERRNGKRKHNVGGVTEDDDQESLFSEGDGGALRRM